MDGCTQIAPDHSIECSPDRQLWHAVTTLPRHEKTTLVGLTQNGIDAFLPTYEVLRRWKNRQTVAIIAPLFPTYLFVRIAPNQRLSVLRTPGVRQLVGNRQALAVISADEVETLRKAVSERRAQPFDGFVEGSRVRVRSGALQGMEGYLLRKSKECRIVIHVQLINQHAAIEVNASDIELLDVIPT